MVTDEELYVKPYLPGLEPLKFDEKTFDLLATIYAKHSWTIRVSTKQVEEFSCRVNSLHKFGLVMVQDHFEVCAGQIYDVHISIAGQRYILNYDPVTLTKVFIKTRFLHHAAYWIQRYIPIKQLPEFLTHGNSFIREAAAGKYTGECSLLITPNDLDTRTHS